MQLVIAAITTSPLPKSKSSPSTGDARVVGLLIGGVELGVELVVDLAQQHPVLRPLGPGERGLDRAHVELERVGEQRLGRAGVAPQALRLRIGARPARSASSSRPVSSQIIDASARRSGRSRRSRHIRAPCWRSSRGRRAAECRGRGRKIRRSGRRRPSARSIWVTVSTRSVAVMPSLQLAGEPEADDFGDQHARPAGRASPLRPRSRRRPSRARRGR